MKDLDMDVKLVEWESALHAQQALSAQWLPTGDSFDAVPIATKQVENYFADLKTLLE